MFLDLSLSANTGTAFSIFSRCFFGLGYRQALDDFQSDPRLIEVGEWQTTRADPGLGLPDF